MDFKLTEEQELLIEGFRDFLDREMTESYLAKCDKAEQYPFELAKKLAENGYASLGIPENYGGAGVDLLTRLLVVEELAKHGAPYCALWSGLLVEDMIIFGNEEQIKKTSEIAADGTIPLALNITEPQAGSDTNNIQCTATRKNGKVYLNGQKTFCTYSGFTPYMLCLTKDPEAADPHKAISMWFVDMSLPGIQVSHIDKLGSKTSPSYDVFLDDVEIEESDLVGVEGEGFIQLMKNFEVERLTVCAGTLGMAECAFEDAARYANQRVQFGSTIGSYQLIQQKISEMAIKIENMKNMIYKCASDYEDGTSIQVSSAMCKYYVGRSSMEVVDDALQVLGGIGLTDAHRVSRMWRDTRFSRIGGGTDEIMIRIMGRSILKQYK